MHINSEFGNDFYENLPPDIQLQRANTIQVIRASIEEWFDAFVLQQAFDLSALGELVKYFVTKYQNELDDIVNYFGRREWYLNPPSICLSEGERYPTIWIAGWRQQLKPERTSIHDHFNSEAVVYGFKGVTQNIEYKFDHDLWQAYFDKSPQKWKQDDFNLPFTKKMKQINEGDFIFVPAPYIHRLGHILEPDFGATIHSYYPPLKEMNYYQEDFDSQKLYKSSYRQRKIGIVESLD